MVECHCIAKLVSGKEGPVNGWWEKIIMPHLSSHPLSSSDYFFQLRSSCIIFCRLTLCAVPVGEKFDNGGPTTVAHQSNDTKGKAVTVERLYQI